jgi:hypothetical protein
MDELLTQEELEVLNQLAAAWNTFQALPEMGPSHKQEFLFSLHRLQHIVMARPAMRHFQSQAMKALRE